MVSYDSEDAVSGVIVIAEGGDDPVVASDLTRECRPCSIFRFQM